MLSRAMLVVAAAAALLAAMACGGDSNDQDDDGGAATSAPAATRAATEAPDGAATEAPDEAEPTEAGRRPEVTLPDDVCPLLTDDQVATMVPDSRPPDPRTGSEQGIEMRGCLWSSSSTVASLELTLMAVPAEVPTSVVLEALQSELDRAGANGREVSGLGELAFIVTGENGSDVWAYANGMQVGLSFSGVGPADEAKLLELAKVVVFGP